jgi:Domain of unknown function (DUF5666)
VVLVFMRFPTNSAILGRLAARKRTASYMALTSSAGGRKGARHTLPSAPNERRSGDEPELIGGLNTQMRIPPWRVALTGAAIVILLLVGVGLVAASVAGPAASTQGNVAAPAATGAPSTTDRTGLRERIAGILGRRVGRAAQHFVDGTLTFTDKDGNLVTIQLDHGTIASIGSDSITIAEASGRQVTVSTDATTVVRLGGGAGIGKLSDLKVGDQVFVQSRLDGSTTLAKHILRVPPKT